MAAEGKAGGGTVGAKAAGKKKVRKGVTRGIAFVSSTFNNTIVTITDLDGATLSWASAGTMGFKGARKSTPFAAGRAAEKAASEARKHGMVEIEVSPPPGTNIPPIPKSRRSRARKAEVRVRLMMHSAIIGVVVTSRPKGIQVS